MFRFFAQISDRTIPCFLWHRFRTGAAEKKRSYCVIFFLIFRLPRKHRTEQDSFKLISFWKKPRFIYSRCPDVIMGDNSQGRVSEIIGAPRGAAVLVRSLPLKSRRMLTRDVLDASSTYAQDKMEAFTAVFSRLSDLGVEQTGPLID